MAACHATVATFWGDISNGVLIDRTLTSLRTLAIGYGLGLHHIGKLATLLSAAAVIITLGFVCARLLRQRKPADALG